MYYHFEQFLRQYDRDKDELLFITYRPPWHMFEPTKYKQYTDILLNLCINKLSNLTDFSLREKYLWLKEWTNKLISMNGTAKEWYEKEQQEKQAAHRKEIEERDIALNWRKPNQEPSANECTGKE